MKQQSITVTIDRGSKQREVLHGTIIQELDKFVKVSFDPSTPDKGEWFAKQSKCVNCTIES